MCSQHIYFIPINEDSDNFYRKTKNIYRQAQKEAPCHWRSVVMDPDTVTNTYHFLLCYYSDGAGFILHLFIWCWWKTGSNPITSKTFCVTWEMASIKRTAFMHMHAYRRTSLWTLNVWSESWSWEKLICNLFFSLLNADNVLVSCFCLHCSLLCDCVKAKSQT